MTLPRYRLRRHRSANGSLWALPGYLVCYVLVIDVLAVVVTAFLLIEAPPASADLRMVLVIIGLGLINGEISRHVERVRRSFSDTPHVNLTSIWTVAAALLLSPGLAAAVVVVLYAHLWIRSWYQVRGVRPYRLTFSAATIVLACHAASAVQYLLGPRSLVTVAFPESVWGIPLVVVVFSAVNSGLVAGAIGLSKRTLEPVRIFGTWSANMLEFATICLGALAAILLDWKPLLVVFFLFALHVLHRGLVARQFEQTAATDPATRLLNANAWRAVTAKEFDRARRENAGLGVLVVDIDHFTQVNDAHGRRAGDLVLAAVAEVLRTEVGRYDVVGRFNGGQYAVALPDVHDEGIAEFSERVCERVRALRVPINDNEVVDGLSVSIGAARYPATDGGLDQLLLAADLAVFAAKDSGRDQVVVARQAASRHAAGARTSTRPGGPEPT